MRISKSQQPAWADELPEPAPGTEFAVVLGAGRFGAKAARILARRPNWTVWVVDRDEARRSAVADPAVRFVREDGIDFLVSQAFRLPPEVMIVPALPVHVAAEWICRAPAHAAALRTVAVPETVRSGLPHTWVGDGGSLLVSYADFLCPEDCPEPEDGCTITGEVWTPLYQVMGDLEVPGFRIDVLRSRQLAPGLGGYPVHDLRALRRRILEGGGGYWLIGTACRCHGTLTGVEVRDVP